MHFNKLFSTLTSSTIWDESKETRLVWVTMLAMADGKGQVHAAIPGLAHQSRVTTAECQEALRVLMAPDPFSRTKDFDGRRIKEIDGGWQLLNHGKYRLILASEKQKESKKEWAARNRARVKAEADAKAAAEQEALQQAADGPPLPTDDVEEFSDKD
jgi:hypothetical protein